MTACRFSQVRGVGEVVTVRAVGGNDDLHGAGYSGECAGAGVGDDGDGELRGSAVHGGGVHQDEGTGLAGEGAGDFLNGDVGGGAFGVSSGGEHLALAGGFKVAVELLTDGEAGELGVGGGVGLRRELDGERAGGVGHGWGPWSEEFSIEDGAQLRLGGLAGEGDAGDGLEVGEEGDFMPGGGLGGEELGEGGLLAEADFHEEPAAGREQCVSLGDEATVDFKAGGAGEEGGRGFVVADLRLESGAV
jgi:hypothetical protein